MREWRSFTQVIIATSVIFSYGCGAFNDIVSDDLAFSRGAERVGSAAADYLKDAPFSTLIVEVAYVQGFAPNTASLDYLKSFLQARLNKSGGITVQLGSEIPAHTADSLTLSEVQNLETTYRKHYSSGKTAAAFFMFLDKPYSEDTSALKTFGLAYGPSSMVVFEKSVIDDSGSSRTLVESSVLTHEFSHILGLVDTGSKMVTDHHDPNHAGHCNNPKCLMYYATNTSPGWRGKLTDPFANIPKLDANCLADLKQAGGK